MKRFKTRLLSVCLVITMLVLLLPQFVFAATAGDFTYEIVDGKAVVTAYTGTAKAVTVPDLLESCPVTEIDAYAFAYNMTLQSVTLPATVMKIDDYAFGADFQLNSINMPADLETIGEGAFAFCFALTSVTFGEKLLSIGNTAFGMSGLTSITLPASLTTLGDAPFIMCGDLTEILVAPGNVNFSQEKGTLCNLDGTTLIAYPSGLKDEAYTIPSSVTSIGKAAFTGNLNLTVVTIPASVTSLGESAFEVCPVLINANFLGNAPTLGDYVFDSCDPGFATYHLASATGFTMPLWYGYPSAVFTEGKCTVNFNSNGGTAVAAIVSDPGTKITRPAKPTRSGYTFVDWFSDPDGLFAFDFANETVNTNLVLQARWLKTAMSGVTAKSASYNSTKLTWTPSAGADAYEIYRSTSSTVSPTKYTTVSGGTTAGYTNTGLATGKTYYYQVRAISYGLNDVIVPGTLSAIVSAKPVMTTPAAKAASAGYSSIKVSWTATSGAHGYEVWRSTTNLAGSYTKVKTITSGSTISFTSTGLSTGKTYYYKVRAFHVEGTTTVYGSYSAAASIKPVPSVPANFKAARLSTTSIKTSWTAVSGASGYEVWRSPTNLAGSYAKVGTVTHGGASGSTVSYTNSYLTAKKVYYYKVRTYRYVGTTKVYGAFSAEKSA
jgi:hypothetical protein